MALNETQVAIQAAKRLKMDGRSLLSLQTLIPSALNNLARQTASDPNRRRLLVTDQITTTSNITGNNPYYADLTDLENSPAIMLDFIQFGTIYYVESANFTSTDVNVLSDSITITAHGFSTGDAISFTTTGTLPNPIVVATTYYVINSSEDLIQIAATYQDAIDGSPINLTTQGSGSSIITNIISLIAQWLGSPTIASFTPCVPFESANIWLVGDKLYTNKIAGTFQMSVPFIPTLDTLPAQLQNDLIDEVINLATDAGYEVKEESEK